MATTIRDTRPTATKKALAEWSEQTNYTIDKIKDLLADCKFNRQYDISDEFALYLQKEVFKHFESIDTDEEVKAFMVQYMTEHPSSKYRQKTEEEIMYAEIRTRLSSLLDKILADMKVKEEVKASDYEEWTEDFQRDVIMQWGNWSSVYDDNGNWAWGKAFNCFFSYWYTNNHVFNEFHCYAYQKKKDVLFTRNYYTFDRINKCYTFENNNGRGSKSSPIKSTQKRGNSGCLGILISIIAFTCLIIYMLR